MNPDFLGDSYDIIKKVFLNEVSTLGYRIIIDPMFTGVWTEEEKEQYSMLIRPRPDGTRGRGRFKSVLFLDPDTGVRDRDGKQHVSFNQLAKAASQHAMVICFDQSFSFSGKVQAIIQSKLESLADLGCHGMYYDSHARFLFVSQNCGVLRRVAKRFVSIGIPASRFIVLST